MSRPALHDVPSTTVANAVECQPSTERATPTRIDADERVIPGPVDVGTTWQASGRVLDEQITVTIEVTAYEPDVRFGLRVSGSIEAEQTFAVDPSRTAPDSP